MLNKKDLKEHIAFGNLEDVLLILLGETQHTPWHKDVLMLSGPYYEGLKSFSQHLTDAGEWERARAHIRQGLLNLIDRLPDDLSAPVATSVAAQEPPTPPPSDASAPIRHAQTPFYFSVGSLLVLLALTVFLPGWQRDNNTLAHVLMALAAAGVAATLPGFLSLEWGVGVKAGGSLAVFALVYFLQPASEGKEFGISIYVKAPPRLEAGIAGAKVTLDMKDYPYHETAVVSANGEAQFRNLSPKFRGKAAQIEIKGRYLEARQTEYVISDNDKLSISLTPAGLDKVWGTVRADGQFLTGTPVRIGQHDTLTDAAGRFRFDIPAAEQDTVQTLVVQSDGYYSLEGSPIYEIQVTPYTLSGDGVPVVLTKKKKK